MELSKANKKVARTLIEKGLQAEFAQGLNKAGNILDEWKYNPTDNKTAYYALYEHIAQFDKHIARRYDGMTGSKYLDIIVAQIIDKLLTEDDLAVFSEEVKERIMQLVHFYTED